jgi:glycosyltransferase involved in cell wall biosynthesis
MNILHVIPSLAPRYGGPSVACPELCRALAQRGHRVSIFTTNRDGSGVQDVPLGVPVEVDGVYHHYFPIRAPRAWATSPALARALRRAVPGADVVHVHSLFLFPTTAAAHAARRSGVPYLIRPHGTLDPFLRRRHPLRKAVYTALLERRNLAGAAAIHFTSDEERELAAPVTARYASVVVPLGVRVPDESPDPGTMARLFPETTGRRVVLFLGRLNFKKGLDLLIPAFAALRRAVPDAHLLLAGPDDGYGGRVRAWVDEHRLREHVTLAGFLGGPSKWAVLAAAQAFVLPSYTENFGLSVVEALAAGTPVIVSDRVNVCREIEQAGAGIVVPPSVPALAAALVEMFRDRGAARRLGEAGRRLARRRFTWERAACDMEMVYGTLVGRRRRGVVEADERAAVGG